MERFEDITLGLLDDAASAAEIKELDVIVSSDKRAREAHIALVELEAVLRGGREGLDLTRAILARVRRDIGERVEKGVMRKIRGEQRPARGRRAPVDIQPVETERRWVASRGFWLVSASAAALIVAAVGLYAGLVASRRARPQVLKTAPGDPAKVAKERARGLAASGKLVDLIIELPKPAFIGTPKNFRTDNLEPAKGDKPRPPHKVLAGTKLLSRGKPITASDEDPIIGEIEQVTDGDKEAGDGSYVEFGPGLQWAQIDLEAECEIQAIVVWHYHGDPRVYFDVVVQVADDPDFITGVKTIFNNDHDNSSGLGIGRHYEYFDTFEGRLIDARGVRSRYVRLYSNGSTADEMNRYTEVEVHGRPATGAE
jgi:hypothetical protein